MNGVRLLKYGTTNTYLIEGRGGYLLLDTGWAGTLPAFYRALGEMKVAAQEIRYVLVTHYHPDHMGIVQDVVNTGAQLVIVDVQKNYVHGSDAIFAKEAKTPFTPVDESRAQVISCAESRAFLKDFGIDGEILHSPGHSDDSISLWLDQGVLFVGDLNPLYEREMHLGTQIDATWEMLLAKKPKTVYYGHAKPAELEAGEAAEASGRTNLESTTTQATDKTDPRLYTLVGRIMKYIDKGMNLQKIVKKTGADATFVEDVARMYLTHTNVGVQGILDRIEIKGK
jgi:glyoxylase-like metal-dependent hydrolase (beta-lactamase superfamily II)